MFGLLVMALHRCPTIDIVLGLLEQDGGWSIRSYNTHGAIFDTNDHTAWTVDGIGNITRGLRREIFAKRNTRASDAGMRFADGFANLDACFG